MPMRAITTNSSIKVKPRLVSTGDAKWDATLLALAHGYYMAYLSLLCNREQSASVLFHNHASLRCPSEDWWSRGDSNP